MHQLLECVPNVSEGRDKVVIDRLTEVLESSPEIKLLHVDVGYSANRTVFTFVGSPSGVLAASYNLVKSASKLIDMRKHLGNHPCLGAVDVCPFVPFKKEDLALCVSLSEALAEKVSKELGVPVYLYEASAKSELRKRLSNIRRGEFKGLQEKIKLAEWIPDYGKAKAHPTFGALITGARNFLIAYNINLDSQDLTLAKKIARGLRDSGENASCRAIAWQVEEYNCCQVSTNLTDFEDFNMHQAYEKCSALAKENNLNVNGSEIIGLVPRKAILESGEFYNCKSSLKLTSEKQIIELAIKNLGLSSVKEFKAETRIIENLL